MWILLYFVMVHIYILEGPDVPAYLSEKISVHQIGVPNLLFSGRLLGVLPNDLCLIGVQPKVLEVGIALSEELNAVMTTLTTTVVEKLKSWNATMTPRERRSRVQTWIHDDAIFWGAPSFRNHRVTN
jgi:hypothetical protein